MSSLALVSVMALLAPAIAAASTVSPLPASDYTVRPVCSAPAPGHAGCLALQLLARTPAARAHTHPLGITRSAPIRAASAQEGAFGLRPQDLHSVYRLPNDTPSTQTIALVDAYNDLSAEADLKVYDEEFGLPECTGENQCFEKVNQNGETGSPPFPASKEAREAEEATCESNTATEEAKESACEEVREADRWSEEISLDIEVSHAICQNCRIALVEADSSSFSNLGTAEDAAAGLGATEISDSWGGPECFKRPHGHECAVDSPAFNHQGIVVAAAAGDDGYLDWDAEEGSEKGYTDYPASSPHVVAVGGTRLSLGPGSAWAGETVWNGDGAGGGGCSVKFTAPPWQQSTPDWSSVECGTHRAAADVSADADPYTGLAVYDSVFKCEYEENHVIHVVHWCTIGGTSLASPTIASVFALAGGASAVEYPAKTLYENAVRTPGSLNDVISGSNGECLEAFDEETGLSGCGELQEAASCSQEAICLARTGYDGPTGVGTPDGIAAFQSFPGEVDKGKASGPNGSGEEAAKDSGEGGAGNQPVAGPGGAVLTGGPPSTGSSATKPSAIVPILSAVALTKTATAALSHGMPKTSQIAFAFTLNIAASVKVTLAKQVRTDGRRRWQTLPYSLQIAAAKGRDRGRLSARATLAAGRYRLKLAPAHGVARTLTFTIG